MAGRIPAAPAGATPLAREENIRILDGFSVDFSGQRASVGSGRYEWLIPPTLRGGVGGGAVLGFALDTGVRGLVLGVSALLMAVRESVALVGRRSASR